MAACCHTPRRQTGSATSNIHAQSHTSDQQFYSDLADSSTYIFPHPSSAPPSPSRSPLFSDTSDISLSAVSISNYSSPKSGSYLSPDGYLIEHSPLTQPPPSSRSHLNLWTDGRGVSWNLDNSPHLDSILLGADVQALGNNARLKVSNGQSLRIPVITTEPNSITTKFRHPLARTPTNPTPPLFPSQEQLPRAHIPHPLSHSPIPLLSFFTSLLFIEGSTVDLITCPTPSVSSFPTEVHTAEKFLSVIASENGFKSIRQGMRSLEGRPMKEFNLVSSGLWDIVTGFLSSGRKFVVWLF